VNWSRRRTAVISWLITAGVLCGAVGMVSAAPAAADPAAAGDAADAGARVADADPHSNAVSRSPRARRQAPKVSLDGPPHHRGYPGPAAVRLPAGSAPAATDEPDEWHRPCHIIWPVWPWPTPLWPTPLPSDNPQAKNNNIIYAVSPYGPALPPPVQIPAFIAPTVPGLETNGPSDSFRGASQAPSVAEPRRLQPSAAPAAPPPPAAPLAAPLPQSPEIGARPPEGGRLGYPEYLRDADFARIAAVALSGLAGFVAITALGGFLGYRQAKAGYVLPPAGTVRFLQ